MTLHYVCGKISLVDTERCLSGLKSWSWKPVTVCAVRGFESAPLLHKTSSILFGVFNLILAFSYGLEKYSRGRRGAPAKGVGRETVARVQIPPSPPDSPFWGFFCVFLPTFIPFLAYFTLIFKWFFIEFSLNLLLVSAILSAIFSIRHLIRHIVPAIAPHYTPLNY